MILKSTKIGSAYTHLISECNIHIEKEVIENDARTPYIEVTRWRIRGMLRSQTGSRDEIGQKIRALNRFYTGTLTSMILYYPNGSTKSQHQLLSANSIGGIRVIQPPTYPDMKGPTYITFHEYELAVEAHIPIRTDQIYVSFVEELAFEGGGNRYGFLEPLYGFPIKQLLKQNTKYVCIQSGRAVGLWSRPVVPNPIFPFAQMEAPRYVKTSPRNTNGTNTEYPIAWQYRFESASRLSGNPNRWRGT